MNYMVLDWCTMDMESTVFISQDGKNYNYKIPTNFDGMVPALIGIAYNHDIYNIKTNCIPDVLQELQQKFHEEEMSAYAQNKITIEGF